MIKIKKFKLLKLNEQNLQQKQLITLAHAKMPFGKYVGRYLIDLPEHYIVWYNRKVTKGEL